MAVLSDKVPLGPLDLLSQTLWRQRRLLEVLQYKLEVERLLLANGGERWLDLATGEVEMVLEAMRTEELTRATELDALVRRLGLDPDLSLAGLIEACDPPWDDIFRDHRASLLCAVAAVEDLSRGNRALLRQGLSATQDFLRQTVHGPAEGYSRSGQAAIGRALPAMFDSDA